MLIIHYIQLKSCALTKQAKKKKTTQAPNLQYVNVPKSRANMGVLLPSLQVTGYPFKVVAGT